MNRDHLDYPSVLRSDDDHSRMVELLDAKRLARAGSVETRNDPERRALWMTRLIVLALFVAFVVMLATMGVLP